MAAAASNKFRTYALTGSVAAITATGAWYGAGLKTRQEVKRVDTACRTHGPNTDFQYQGRSNVLEATAAERVQQMETARARLLQRRVELHAKIDRLTNKVNAEDHADASQEG